MLVRMFAKPPGYAWCECLWPSVTETVALLPDLAATALANVTAAFGG
jgi:hypothetical protein